MRTKVSRKEGGIRILTDCVLSVITLAELEVGIRRSARPAAQRKWQAAISFKQVEPEVLALEGTVDGQQIRGRFRRMDESRFPLLSRGFHWINEWPFDR